MSGPITPDDAPATDHSGHAAPEQVIELLDSRVSQVGSFRVRRALPRRAHRTVGSWCFADHLGPVEVTEAHGIDIGPHPHMGLQTVTWLLAGEILHRDSLGSEQLIRAGQLNLMTAGRGLAHAEEATGAYRGPMHGIQLWVAQPDSTRNGAAAFEHHAELPVVELDAATATVLVGAFAGVTSPARRDTDHAGVDLALRPGTTTAPLQADHEHALVVLDGAVMCDGVRVEPGHLAYLGPGRTEIVLRCQDATRAMLLGGVPFPDELVMWWNFVARTTDEVDAAYRSWQDADERFGVVRSPLARIPAPRPAWAGRAD